MTLQEFVEKTDFLKNKEEVQDSVCMPPGCQYSQRKKAGSVMTISAQTNLVAHVTEIHGCLDFQFLLLLKLPP